MENMVCLSRELITRNVDFNRNAAIHECVLKVNPLKKKDFHDFFNSNVSLYDPDWEDKFHRFLAEFIEKKGIRIISEKPFVQIKDGKYVTVVTYEIGW